MMTLRVASLLPSATDTIASLHLTQLLVAKSHECDANGIDDVPICTEAKCGYEQGLTSEEIHFASTTSKACVLEACFQLSRDPSMIIEWVLSPYRTDWNALTKANPDVVLTQIQTASSGLTMADVEQALHEAMEHPVKVVHLDPQSMEEALGDILAIAESLRHRKKGEELVASMRRRMGIAQAMTLGRARCEAVCLVWTEPLFPASAWVSDLIHLAGGHDVVAKLQPSGRLTWDWIERSAARVLVFLIRGRGLRDSVNQVKSLILGSVLRKIVRRGIGVAVADGVRLFSKPGPSLVASLEVLTEIFHPEAQPYGHRGELWLPLT